MVRGMKGHRVIASLSFALPLSLLSSSLAYADAPPAGVVFTSVPQTIGLGAVSEQISVQVQDADNNQSKVPSTACASLTSSASGGEFSSSASAWSPVSVLTIAKNSANRNFYYKDGAVGVATMSIKVVLKPEAETRSCASWPLAEWPLGWSATQKITVGEGSAETPPPPAQTASSSSSAQFSSEDESAASAPAASSGGGGAPLPPLPHIFVGAQVSARAAAGADLAFDAIAVGLKKEPLPNARFVWTFGDGGSAEGKRVLHAYHLPATYVVMVEASSGEWSATDRREIVISAPQLLLSRLAEGADGFIEVRNNGRDDLDLSRWFLRSGGAFFSFPAGTILKRGGIVPFPSVITKLIVSMSDTALLYPNGTEAVRYAPEAVMPQAEEQPFAPSKARTVPTEATEKETTETTEKKEEETVERPHELATTTELLASVEASGAPLVTSFASIAGVITLLGTAGFLMKK